jgi:hypothetical protein
LGQSEGLGGPREVAMLVQGKDMPTLAQIDVHKRNLSNDTV